MRCLRIYSTLATEIDRCARRLYIGSRGEINPVDTSIHRLTYRDSTLNVHAVLYSSVAKC